MGASRLRVNRTCQHAVRWPQVQPVRRIAGAPSRNPPYELRGSGYQGSLPGPIACRPCLDLQASGVSTPQEPVIAMLSCPEGGIRLGVPGYNSSLISRPFGSCLELAEWGHGPHCAEFSFPIAYMRARCRDGQAVANISVNAGFKMRSRLPMLCQIGAVFRCDGVCVVLLGPGDVPGFWCLTCKPKQIQNLHVVTNLQAEADSESARVGRPTGRPGSRCAVSGGALRRGSNIGAKCVASVPLHANIDCDCRDSSLFVHMAEMCHVT